jgi:uncharacterized membrane protein YgdD (TMEM256/DUF423 family)
MNTNQESMLRVSSIFGALAVLIGAFGAHGLKAQLSPEALTVFDTGVKYHFYHTLALWATTIYFIQSNQAKLKTTFWLFVAGIVLFSGSLYIIATKSIHGLNLGALGILTPIGGLFFIAAWISLGFGFQKNK